MIRLYSQRNIGSREHEKAADFFASVGRKNIKLVSEWCYYIESSTSFSSHDIEILTWLFKSHENFAVRTFSVISSSAVIEIGSRQSFETAWSSAAVSITSACGIANITRIERSRRYNVAHELTKQQEELFVSIFADAMTEERYRAPLTSFSNKHARKVNEIFPLTKETYFESLAELSKNEGLGWDRDDIEFIGNLFVHTLRRNPSKAELFQIAQANSEHSRHWFFKGRLSIDGKEMDESLMEIVQTPWKKFPNNSLIAFCDDSSALRGKKVASIIPQYADKKSPYIPVRRTLHPTLTAETHNFPTGIAPYPGAATGTGGRIRDNEAVGRGGHVIASAAAYCVGNLHIPGYTLPWENDGWQHPKNLASPLSILIQASNGASDYGNCFGEPVIAGFVRTGGIYSTTEYRSWLKPIMYTAGIGQIDDQHIHAESPMRNMLLILLGGPSYRIGIGGGSASSISTEAARDSLDFRAVQRGNPEMGQRLNRVIRSCIEMAENNPLKKIVDLGAGGACNALTELLYSSGGKINLDAFPLGDKSLSILELWINESQERIAALIHPYSYQQILSICKRERVMIALVGIVTKSGEIHVTYEKGAKTAVRLPLEHILGNLPQKTFHLKSTAKNHRPFSAPKDFSFRNALLHVLRLPSVGSKRFLTTKVDRSVTGLVARQQCIGPNHLPLSDFGLVAQSHFAQSGIAFALGEAPLKGLISAAACARMAVSEMLLNMAGARIGNIESIKCSANWMLAAKETDGDGAWLHEAVCALRDICIALGIAIDGGKDSLSMASNAINPDGKEEKVLAPSQLVVAGYAPVPNIKTHITPDIKRRGSHLILIDPSEGSNRIGGSALAQISGQTGDTCPDIDDPKALASAFKIAGILADKGLVLSMHDRSDGGLITAALEMAFAGNTGLTLSLCGEGDPIHEFFSEEAGLLIETSDINAVWSALIDHKSACDIKVIGKIPDGTEVKVVWNNSVLLTEDMTFLRATWEETSSAIDMLQANPLCVKSEQAAIKNLASPPYALLFTPKKTSDAHIYRRIKPAVAILREEGSNGDREMASAFFAAGFDPFDVTMTDFLQKKVALAQFRGIAFVGGFSFADVPQAGKGWAAIIRYNQFIKEQFRLFYERQDTFSLGVCNGCQLMAYLGVVGPQPWWGKKEFRFVQNTSERFESRFSTVRIEKSPSIFFRGMTDSILGIWVAHGEGRIYAKKQKTISQLVQKNLVPLRYTDNNGEATEQYPYNPNGSPHGIAAVCSPDGRHLAMMPHPERTFITWQWPWMPESWKKMDASPWLRLFQNAYDWCMK
ncbi:MAG: phosphoribosylformylglycinamidine synthase [Parcubacteria group bacterium Gr01-1014_48]|nr:MAG: phosphoribosylformylglycinamidine synthase [Parcubacteria group bacterium Greene0416_14]TSC72932.1 MAG: phosphoribosylformylglycinamidine synthase [Parcubacteria group bacterium Gr01-1014_48]TSD01500.1 MAG: phosphoribosylformylglycinamidine synthase [Parcubacteria group bacterium Greene1014_15]TSD08322.1 MAG: phosphoribosylformylglycinamidine synthase [Parcubacteria group bacterium Greene0714_4]